MGFDCEAGAADHGAATLRRTDLPDIDPHIGWKKSTTSASVGVKLGWRSAATHLRGGGRLTGSDSAEQATLPPPDAERPTDEQRAAAERANGMKLLGPPPGPDD